MINRIKAVVLALFVLYWVAVVLILMAARPVFARWGDYPEINFPPRSVSCSC